MTSTSGRISDKKAADSPEPSRLLKMASGSISGLLVSVVLQPLDVVRTTMQTEAAKSANRPQVVPTVRSIITEGGVQALWRGSSATVVRLGLGAGLHFLFIDIAKSALQRPMPDGRMGLSPGAAALAGGCARALSAAALCPVTLVKTRLEYGRGEQMYRGPVMAVRQIYTAEGARGLFRGLGPTILTNAPFSGLYYMFYTQLQVALPGTAPLRPAFWMRRRQRRRTAASGPSPLVLGDSDPVSLPVSVRGSPRPGRLPRPLPSARAGPPAHPPGVLPRRDLGGRGAAEASLSPPPPSPCLPASSSVSPHLCSLVLFPFRCLPPSLPIRIAHLRSEIAFLRSRSFSELVFGLPFWSLPSLCSTFFASMFVSPSEKWDGRLTIARHLKSGLGFAELVSGRAADCGSGPEGGGTLLARGVLCRGRSAASASTCRPRKRPRGPAQGSLSAEGRNQTAVNFGSGTIAAAAATIITQPADIVRTRSQMGLMQQRMGMIKALQHIASSQGPAALMTGTTPKIVKKVLQTALVWTLYEELVPRLSTAVQLAKAKAAAGPTAPGPG
uniref:Solute carrier family 25 member 38 n=1 Tax=Tetraselmis sp. GSL018 TaxID=582737 RepID=A0A061R7A1_9CHLO